MEELDVFYKVKDKWDKLNDQTINKIKRILKKMPGKEMELDHVSHDVKGSLETYEEIFVKVRLEDMDVILTSADNEDYDIYELSMGESLWLLYEML